MKHLFRLNVPLNAMVEKAKEKLMLPNKDILIDDMTLNKVTRDLEITFEVRDTSPHTKDKE